MMRSQMPAPLPWEFYKHTWLRFLEVDKNYPDQPHRFSLWNKETGEFAGSADNLIELNEVANAYLHKLFEKIVLSN